MNKSSIVLRLLPDKVYLQLIYFKHFHRFINFKNPITFNEKLQWLKLNNRNSEYTMMVDKYRVKDYVAKKIGEQYVIPTLGMWESAEKIDFESLPNQFVLKCNNDSGGIVICKDKSKLDKNAAVKLLSSRLKNNGFWYGREWPYKNVKPCIIAEKYLENSVNTGLVDYKVHVFNSKARFILVCEDRYSDGGVRETFYSTDWTKMPFKRPNHEESSQILEKPSELDTMLRLAEALAEGIPFIRVDFYIVNTELFFGELTLYPASGLGRFYPEKYDKVIGDWLSLN